MAEGEKDQIKFPDRDAIGRSILHETFGLDDDEILKLLSDNDNNIENVLHLLSKQKGKISFCEISNDPQNKEDNIKNEETKGNIENEGNTENKENNIENEKKGDRDIVDNISDFFKTLQEKYPEQNYGSLLRDEGFNDFTEIVKINDNILKELGIKKMGHRLIILEEISKLSHSLQQGSKIDEKAYGTELMGKYKLYKHLSLQEKLLLAENNGLKFNEKTFWDDFRLSKNQEVTSIVLLGRTGCGKSTLGNRLTLDISKDGNLGSFEARDGAKSCTSSITRFYMIEDYHFMTSVVDTPGLDDTEGRDQEFIQAMIDFFARFTIGKKIICFVLNLTNHRIDAKIQAHLILAHALFGNIIWNNLVIIITHVDIHPTAKDIGEDNNNKYEKLKRECAEIMMERFSELGLKKPPPIFSIGKYNYVETVQQLFQYSRKVPPFDCELIQNLNKYNLANDIYSLWISGCNLAMCVYERIAIAKREEKKLMENQKNRRLQQNGQSLKEHQETTKLVNAMQHCTLPAAHQGQESRKSENGKSWCTAL